MNHSFFPRLDMQLGRALILLCLLVVSSVPQLEAQSAAADITFQDFDTPGTGTPYAIWQATDSLRGPELFNGGPSDTGKLMRLAYQTPVPTHNGITFDSTNSKAFDQIIADFDFRMNPGSGRADGFSFALLNTAHYGTTGKIGPVAIAEEPNFTDSLGVGFDIYKSSPPTEVSNNHLSIHFKGTLVKEFDVKPMLDLDLAGGQWIHARIIMRPGGGYSDVTVTLTECGRAPITVIDQFKVAGFTPYVGRVYFAARSGFQSADQDIDNVRVNSLGPDDSLISVNNGCFTSVETDSSKLLTITRMGNISGTASVHYATANLTATAPSDYSAISGTLTFSAGQTTKTVSVPIVNDNNSETEESFLFSLSSPSLNTTVGGPAVSKVTIVDNTTAQTFGHWSEVIRSDVVPIHMHLLPTGQVLYWDRHDDKEGWDGRPRLWDPATGTISMAPMPEYDLFCSGHSFLADGRLLVTGGHIDNGVGEDKASIYNPFTNSWEKLLNMNAGRWYPSNVTLTNGDTLVLGGTYLDISTNQVKLNALPQIWETGTGDWRNLTNAPISTPAFADYYPFLYLAPNGKIFDAGPQQSSYYLDPSGLGAWTAEQTKSIVEYRDYGSSVMYDDGRVLIVGGNKRDKTSLPEKSAEVIDLNGPSPVLRRTNDMNVGRRQLNATLLPDGMVLVTGGSKKADFDDSSGAVLDAELWDPGTETWTKMAAEARYRGYHSTALLLPDGRVLVGGGGHPNPASGAQYNFEIYSPPYLFKGARPTITSAPALVAYGEQFTVRTPNATTIDKVTLVRLSSVTHSFNQNQRFKKLDFVQASGGITVTVPANPNLLPPGYYMLFILNRNGVPSVGRMIRIDNETIVSIGGKRAGGLSVPPQSSQRASFVGTNGGPVRIQSTNGLPIFTSERAIFGNSFNSIVGYPGNQLTTDYWFTSYDDVGMTTFLVIGNPSTSQTAQVNVYIEGNKMNASAYSIPPGGRIFPRYGINGGPVLVDGINGVNVFASERTKFGNSFNEIMGYPANRLTSEYWFTSYDDVGMITYLVIGNPSISQAAQADVYIGGVKQNASSISIAPGQRTFLRYGINAGPVRVVSTNGVNLFTSERTKFGDTFNEVMGYPANRLTSEYWFTSYDDTSMITYLVIGNPSTSQTSNVDVYIGGVKQNATSISIPPGQRAFVRYGINAGPVRVVSTNGVNVFASERSKYLSSFNEILGMAANQITTDYWFTSYDDVGMITYLVVASP